jgi:hypothetical protein
VGERMLPDFSWIKDFVFPVVTNTAGPVLAAAIIIKFFKEEAKRLGLQRQHEQKLNSESFVAMLTYAERFWDLAIGDFQTNGSIRRATMRAFSEAMRESIVRLFKEPEIGGVLKQKLKFEHPFAGVEDKRQFLIVVDATTNLDEIMSVVDDLPGDVDAKTFTALNSKFQSLYFAILTLRYAYEQNTNVRREIRTALTALRDGNPGAVGNQFSHFMVAAD